MRKGIIYKGSFEFLSLISENLFHFQDILASLKFSALILEPGKSGNEALTSPMKIDLFRFI